MTKKIPKWESELWSYLSSGAGLHCPMYSHCPARQRGLWCADDNGEKLRLLIESDDKFDPADFDFTKPQKKESEEYGKERGLFPLVEKLAQRLLKKGRVRCLPVPTELVSLADEHNPIEVRLLPLKAYHGAIWRLREGWVIQLNKNDTPARKRFTLFHEAFHILAHCNSKDAPVFRKRKARQGYFNELLADYFAISVLMPKEWVKEKWAEVKDLDTMAEIFDVPKSAMFVNLKGLGLI